MKHPLITIALLLTSACHHAASDVSVSCNSSHDCPFEQCCVSGTCVDPGLIGTCNDVADLHGTLTFDKTSATAGVDTVTVTASLRDIFNRPLAGETLNITVSSDCTTSCDSLLPGTGSTDASGRFVSSLTSNIAGAKTLTLAVKQSTIATAQINFVAGEGVIQIGFAGSTFDCNLGDSLGNGSVGLVDNTGNFVTTPAASSVPVSIMLAPSDVSIPLVDSGGNPLDGVRLVVDVQRGPVALSSLYVPIAGRGFVLTASTGSQPAISSSPFAVSVDEVTSFSTVVGTSTGGSNVTLSWQTGASGPSAVYANKGVIGFSSPTTVPITQPTTYMAAIVDNRGSPLRTVSLDTGGSVTATSTGDIRTRFALSNGNNVILAGDYQGSMTLGTTTVPPHPAVKTGYTSFVASVATGPLVSWNVVVSGDNSTIKGIDMDATDVYVLAEYSGSGVEWYDGSLPCTAADSGSAALTGVTVAALHIADGHIAWCGSFSPDVGQPASVTGGGLAVSGSSLYVAFNSGPVVDHNGTPFPAGSDTIANKLVIAQLMTDGSFSQSRLSIADYPFVFGGITANRATGGVFVAGGATASNAQVVNSAGQTLTTVGEDALVIALAPAFNWFWQSSAAGNEAVTSIDSDSGGDVVITGTFTGSMGLGNTAVVNNDALADTFVAVLPATAHAPSWSAALHSTSAFDNVSVTADDSQIIVGADAEGPMSIDGSIIGTAVAGSVSTAWLWSGTLLDMVPLPGCHGPSAIANTEGSAGLLVNIPSKGTINPFDINGTVVQSNGPSSVLVKVTPYDFRLQTATP